MQARCTPAASTPAWLRSEVSTGPPLLQPRASATAGVASTPSRVGSCPATISGNLVAQKCTLAAVVQGNAFPWYHTGLSAPAALAFAPSRDALLLLPHFAVSSCAQSAVGVEAALGSRQSARVQRLFPWAAERGCAMLVLVGKRDGGQRRLTSQPFSHSCAGSQHILNLSRTSGQSKALTQ